MTVSILLSVSFVIALPALTRFSAAIFSFRKVWGYPTSLISWFINFDNKMICERRYLILYLDNATVHLSSLTRKDSNTKIAFLPKSKASHLQLHDLQIFQSFKTKYRILGTRRIKQYSLILILHDQIQPQK